MSNNSKITSLAVLRGVAVLAVCFCHFGKPTANGNVLPGLFRWLGDYGQYGVHIFFVISGFVIPFSLDRAKYTIKDYFSFLYKRFLRLHPPYLTGLALTLLIAAASYKSRHLTNPETPLKIFQSLFYFHAPDDNPVFWTLRIEAEYYIFIGIFFVLLTRAPRLSLSITIPLILIASQTPATEYLGLLNYITFFLIGTVGYLIYTKEQNTTFEHFIMTGLILFSFLFYDLPAGLASSLTMLFILHFKKPVVPALEFPGEISYSLYLIHFPIGTKLINLLQRYISPYYYWTLFFLAIVVSFSLAWLFWKFIEKPSARLSNKVKYGKAKTTFKNFSLKT